MATELNMPQMGYDMQEGTLVRWLKAVGDEVSLGDPVAEIETDKAVVEFESTAEGVLLELLVEEGTTVAVGEVIAMVGAAGEDAAVEDSPAVDAVEPEVASEPDDSEEEEAMPMEREEPPQTAIPLPASAIGIRVSPVARRLAAERGIDLTIIEGTGPGGRILREDVIAAADSAALAPEPEAADFGEPDEVEAAHPEEAVDEPDAEVAEEAVDEPDAEVAGEAVDESDAEVVEEAVDEPESEVAEEAVDEPEVEVAGEAVDEPEVEVAGEAVDEPDAEVVEEAVDEPDVEVVGEAVDEPDAEVAGEAVDEPDAEVAEEPVGQPEVAVSLPDGVMPLSRMRQQIARVTTTSKTTIPHFYVTTDIDMTESMALRRQINDSLEGEMRVSVNDLVIKACVGALKRHPNLNATFTDEGIRVHESINVGIAISVGDGLIMPAILDCADMSLSEIAAASQDLALRSQSGTLQSDEYTGGTFSISNMGMFDVTSFVAIIQPPQSAVLAVGTVQKRPVVQGDEIVVRSMMSATLSVDHRVSDGAEGAQFVADVKRQLESPLRLLL